MGHEPVAMATNGQDSLRFGGIVLDFLAQPANVHVDGARIYWIVIPPYFAKQRVSRQYNTRVTGEIQQKVKFLWLEHKLMPGNPGLPASGIDIEIPGLDGPGPGTGAGVGGR